MNDTVVFDFSQQNQIEGWHSIDDQIMGGCSQSSIGRTDAALVFSGTVSLENNGGFASIRSLESDYDLSQGSGLTLKVRGDGKNYKLSLRTDRFFDGISYQADFTTTAGEWQEIRLPFTGFIPTHHGIVMSTVAPLEPAKVQSFGLFIADHQEGPFRLEISEIGSI